MKYKEYLSTLETVHADLDKYGVAVIPDILTKKECKKFANQIWAELKYVTQNRFDIEDESTWREFYKFYPLHSMLLQHFSLGHMQPIWDIRQHPSVCNVFEKLWEIPKEDLLVSFDGLSVHLPPEKTNKGWYRDNAWYHTDQCFTKKDKCCIQGFVNLYDTNDGDATLTVLEGSHKYHQEFAERFDAKAENDWYKLNEDERKFFIEEKKCKPIAVKAKRGSMILWDSRTMHQGKESDKDREEENFRIVVYVCMLPRSTASIQVLRKKQDAFENLRLTTHWVNKVKLFAKTPRTYGGELPEFNTIHQPVLSTLGRRLAGYNK